MNQEIGVRWLGRVPYAEANRLQQAIHAADDVERLVLLEHPHVYTLGSRANTEHLLVSPDTVGAELIHADRGGDITYHGPGQLVGYPILTLDRWMRSGVDVVQYVRILETALIKTLARFGLEAGRNPGYSGVWIGSGDTQRKIAAIGVKVARGRTRHGFALNVNPDLAMFSHIVPCGISEWGVTSLAAELLARGETPPSMLEVVSVAAEEFLRVVGAAASEVVGLHTAPPVPVAEGGSVSVQLLGRLAKAGVDADDAAGPRPGWMRVRASMDEDFIATKARVREHGLVTVCEEAGCPNIYECWSAGTATFMINGERCTRACTFCLVDTRKPEPLDPDEPCRIGDAVATMGLSHAVVTCVARDDLPDDGAGAFAATINEIRLHRPATSVEVLISDCRGNVDSLRTIAEARPDIWNHNLETVARLQRAVRPSAGYARSLAVLAFGAEMGLVTKSGLIAGLGETESELVVAMEDLRSVGVSILTIGQYLQPSPRHSPVMRWYEPEVFERLREVGLAMGFRHVESGPLVRSSYHARDAAEAATPISLGVALPR